MPVVVPCLHTGETVRVQMPTDLARHASSSKQGLDSRPNPLELKPRDRIAHDLVCPTRQRPHADRFLPAVVEIANSPFSSPTSISRDAVRARGTSGTKCGRAPCPG